MYIYYKHEINENIEWKLFTEKAKRSNGQLFLMIRDCVIKKNFWYFPLIFLPRKTFDILFWFSCQDEPPTALKKTCHHKAKSWCANITQTFYPHLPGLSTMKKLWKCVPCNSSLNLPKSNFVTSIFSMNLSNVSFSDLTNISYTDIHLILFPEEGKVD